MSYQKHNFEAGAVLFASQLNDMDNQIEFLSNQGSSFSDNFKTALLNCFENVAWINENGQTCYDALYDSLYPDNMWFITNILTGCVTSNNATNILKNNSYVATITANEGYTLDGATVSITIGGNDVTNLYYSSGSINIPNVTGDLVITVLASSAVASISAVFTQGSATIYDTDSLDTLKQYLTVTATYADSTTAVVTDYTLSGTLTAGTSTITVSYGGKTDTFSVTVSLFYERYLAILRKDKNVTPSLAAYRISSSSGRGCAVMPIANNNNTYTVTNTSTYEINVVPLTSNEKKYNNVPDDCIDGYWYQGANVSISWGASFTRTSPYVWIAIRRKDATDFTDAELANGAAAVFRVT